MKKTITSKVYIFVNKKSYIVRCEGGYTTPKDLDGWIQIDEGIGDKYNLCQSNYFEGGLFTDDGIPRYKFTNGKVEERTEEEINNDRLPIIKNQKINELRVANDSAIDAGTTVTLSTGEESFTYSLADQSNISEMYYAVLGGAEKYSYHQNGGNCRMFDAKDIVVLYSTLSMYKTGLLTYYNQLKQYINSLSDIDSINNVVYGQELTGEYLEKYNYIMAENKAQMEKVMSNFLKS